MSRKNVLAPIPIAAGASLAANASFASTDISFDDNASYQIIVTAAGSSGQFYLQGSDDINTRGIPNFAPTNWTDVMPCGAVAGADDTILIDVNQWPHKYMRLRYQSTVAGAGSCSINLTAKQLGG